MSATWIECTLMFLSDFNLQPALYCVICCKIQNINLLYWIVNVYPHDNSKRYVYNSLKHEAWSESPMWGPTNIYIYIVFFSIHPSISVFFSRTEETTSREYCMDGEELWPPPDHFICTTSWKLICYRHHHADRDSFEILKKHFFLLTTGHPKVIWEDCIIKWCLCWSL